jgi:hypothetical protein
LTPPDTDIQNGNIHEMHTSPHVLRFTVPSLGLRAAPMKKSDGTLPAMRIALPVEAAHTYVAMDTAQPQSIATVMMRMKLSMISVVRKRYVRR